MPAEDLYNIANIVGYTGDLHRFPTVYFQSDTQVGHITQQHPTAQNVGRTAPMSATGYSWKNLRAPDGTVHLVEFLNGQAFHVSRNKMIELNQGDRRTGAGFDFETFAILAQSISNCQGMKYISNYSKSTHDQIKDAKKAKDATMNQLQSLAQAGNAARQRRGIA